MFNNVSYCLFAALRVKIWLSAKNSAKCFLPIAALLSSTLPGRVVITPSLQTWKLRLTEVKWHSQDSAAKKWAVGVQIKVCESPEACLVTPTLRPQAAIPLTSPSGPLGWASPDCTFLGNSDSLPGAQKPSPPAPGRAQQTTPLESWWGPFSKSALILNYFSFRTKTKTTNPTQTEPLWKRE